VVLSLPAQVRVFLARGATDMRKAFDGLCTIVRHQFRRDPFTGDVFVFFNRDRNRVKLLLWDGNGFWLWAKRLERGTFDSWRPPGEAAHVEIERAQLSMLLEGIDLKKSNYRRHFTRIVRIGGGGERTATGPGEA
jgi:transposase